MRITDLWIIRISGIGLEDRESTVLPVGDSGSVEADFVCVRADSDDIGFWGPIDRIQSFFLLTSIRPHILGSPVLAIECLWENIFHLERHGHSGHYVTAVSALDLALWDLIGRHYGLPVCELLGRPLRQQIPAYASMLGFDPDARNAPDIAETMQAEGYSAQKWALRDGPAEGEEGLRRNLSRVSRLREAVGANYRLMVDALGRWDMMYAHEFCRRAEGFNLFWLEEPFPPEQFLSYRHLHASVSVPLAAGEHYYTRFEAEKFLIDGILAFFQPDAGWCGGLTELRRIVALASTYNTPVIPHGGALIPALHMAACTPAHVMPLVEYHVTVEPKRQRFLASPVTPFGGGLTVHTAPGLGIQLDPASYNRRQDIRKIEWL
jgi:L-alanine-DL-glutamate epimerase-like enolase superfamily enzyme